MQIKSAHTVQEFEKLFNQQLRHQGFSKSAKSYIEPYFDIKEVLNPLKPFTNDTCLCTKDLHRLQSGHRQTNERQQRTTTPAATTSNAIKSLNCKNSIEDFVSLASECYEKCINIYLDNLNDCNRRADIIERQSIKSPSGYTGRRSLKPKRINDLSLANRINKLSINLHRDVASTTLDNFDSIRQSPSSSPNCSHQTMSCNDTNNNSTESTNQLKDPPKIVLSDHSTNHTIQGDSSKIAEFSASGTASDKNSLTIPIENYYSGEARPP